jgi:uncharacterized membrane protein
MNLFNKFILALVLLLYFLLGLSHSRQQGFWHDEIYTLTFLKGVSVYDFEGSVWSEQDVTYDVNYFKQLLAEDNFYSNFSLQILHEGHPPIYFILLKLWSYIFGSSEIGLRSFSLCCGLLVFLILFNLFRQRSERRYTSWVVLAMLMFNPFLFYFFTEARMYALALLLAALSFRYWLDYQEHRKMKSPAFLYFCLASIGLLYTHYYGLFFLSSLAFFEFLKAGFKKSILNHSVAVLCFIPWGFAIRKQLNFHVVHWTDGVISFWESIVGYSDGILHLMISPMSDPSFYELAITIVLILMTISFLLVKEWKFTLVLLSAILIYGIQIFVFDQMVGHHSILVPRYYVFVLIFVYWGFFKMIDSFPSKISSLVVPATYVVVTSTIILQLYRLDRAPKQMFREVAGFIDNQVDSKTSTLVFEPKGPLIIGIANYLQNNFKLIPANEVPNNLGDSVVYIDEMLGVAYCENKFHKKQQEKLDFIPFVGVFIYK